MRHEQGTTRRAGPRRGGPGVPVHVGASDDTAWSRRCPNARTCRPPRAHAPDFLPSKPPPRRSDSLMSRGRCPAGLHDRQACTHYWLLAGPDRSHESRNRRTDPADDRNSHASHFEFERERETVGPACATGCRSAGGSSDHSTMIWHAWHAIDSPRSDLRCSFIILNQSPFRRLIFSA